MIQRICFWGRAPTRSMLKWRRRGYYGTGVVLSITALCLLKLEILPSIIKFGETSEGNPYFNDTSVHVEKGSEINFLLAGSLFLMSGIISSSCVFTQGLEDIYFACNPQLPQVVDEDEDNLNDEEEISTLSNN